MICVCRTRAMQRMGPMDGPSLDHSIDSKGLAPESTNACIQSDIIIIM